MPAEQLQEPAGVVVRRTVRQADVASRRYLSKLVEVGHVAAQQEVQDQLVCVADGFALHRRQVPWLLASEAIPPAHAGVASAGYLVEE